MTEEQALSDVDPAPERHRLVRKLESIAPLNETERQALMDLPMTVRQFRDGQDLVEDRSRPAHCCLVLTGFACRYKLLPDGRRQILAFHTPGDMPDLQSLHLKVMDHAVGALTQTSAAFIPHRSMHELVERHPGLMRAFWREALVDAAIFREWEICLGRRNSHEHIAHVLCEMALRFKAVGLARDHSYELPITQSEMGDATGLSTVHVNRVLQDLRRDGLITWESSVVTVRNWERLTELAMFEPIYLYQIGDHAPGTDA